MNHRFEPSRNALDYALRQLLRRAGVDGGIPVLYQQPEEKETRPRIFIVPCAPAAWHELLEKPAGSLPLIPANQTVPPGGSLPFENDIPVLFRGAGCETETKFAEQRRDGTVIFYVDILAATFFMLSRWEETVIAERDRHGRFSATQSVAHKQGFLQIPVVDQYALILRQWMKFLAPDWRISSNPPAFRLTHDIDFIHQYSNLIELIRAFGVAALSRSPLKNIRRGMKNLYNQFFLPDREERLQAVRELAEFSRQYGFKSHFYFMAAKPNRYQQGYDPALPQLKSLYRSLLAQGHEIGLHPGYTTFKNLEILKAERANLEQAAGVKVTEGRQHFLRFEVPQTWRHWEQAGLMYDSTMGYADYEGFRCGTSHPYHPYDIELDREMNILEIPLIVMDVTLRHYRGLTPEQGRLKILELAEKCAGVGGTLTILWHNTSLVGDWDGWAVMYREVLEQLSKRQSASSLQ